MTNRIIIFFLFNVFYIPNIIIGQEPKLMVPFGHTFSITSASFSPTKNQIATISLEGSINLWDLNDNRLLYHLNLSSSDVTNTFINDGQIRFSSDGKLILVSLANRSFAIDYSNDKILFDSLIVSDSILFSNISYDGTKTVIVERNGLLKIFKSGSEDILLSIDNNLELIRLVCFSPDSKNILITTEKKLTLIDISSKKIIGRYSIEDNNPYVFKSSGFNLEGNRILATTGSKTYVWDVKTGNLLIELEGLADINKNANTYCARDRLLISNGSNIQYWDILKKKIISQISVQGKLLEFSLALKGNAIIINSGDSITIYNALTGVLSQKVVTNFLNFSSNISPLLLLDISPNGNDFAFTSIWNFFVNIWSIDKETQISSLKGKNSYLSSGSISRDQQKLVVTSKFDSSIIIWDYRKGKIINHIKSNCFVSNATFTNDSKKVISQMDSAIAIWDIETGRLLNSFKISSRQSTILQIFQPLNSDLLILVYRSKITALNITSGKQLYSIKRMSIYRTTTGALSFDEKSIALPAMDGVQLIDIFTGKQITYYQFRKFCEGTAVTFSNQDKNIIVADKNNFITILDSESGNIIKSFKAHNKPITSIVCNSSGNIISASEDKTSIIWDQYTGKQLFILKGHSDYINSIKFSPETQEVITISGDGTWKKWNVLNGDCKLTLLGINGHDYLSFDSYFHYDGSSEARKLLYFTCGTEVIELDQLKDQLWVPNLAERILKGDSINAPKISDLNICGLTPEVEELDDNKDTYHFKILPRRGGLGETVLYINGIEVKRYKKEQLKHTAGTYELLVKKQELSSYFIPGQENPVTVKAWIADNTISSRGLIIKENKTKENIVPPNLYAVIVGVSDYKGDELDLKYAAKDATDISAAINAASKKLLNTDGKEHVFTYNLTTSNDRYLLPEKAAIRKTLEEIGKRATTNDILLIFFAGHGVMAGPEKKQFYFLTADASMSSSADAVNDVGISTAELTDWIKPANIKAQKRIMIFDACNSGQAIRDFVQLGKPDQGYVAARSDETGQQIKAIEKLNNQSGLIILAASASNQNAYEMGRYSQGLLTYSLLKVIKLQPEILENGKYLDVSNWLNAAKKMVSALAEGLGARQEPQLNSNNNFNIGLIDDEVRNKIILPSEKPLLVRSNFQNASTKTDNLKLRSAIDKELMEIGSREGDAIITYSADYEGADAYSLTGDYKINGDNILVSVLITKGGIEILHRFEVTGITADINKLSKTITAMAVDWLKNHK